MIDVVVYHDPSESVETITSPVSVETDPSELVVVNVVVYSVNSGPVDDSLMIDVVVYHDPSESVETITSPVSVETDPSELVVVNVVVYSCLLYTSRCV